MAEVFDYQDVYRRLGEMQPKIDDLFLQAIENSEFRSASIIIRVNASLDRDVDNVDVLSQEYRSSSFAKNAGQLGKSLIPEESVESRSLRVRFIWSDAYELLGESALSPISESLVPKLYVGSIIRRRYESSVQNMFQNLDRSSGSSVPGSILVDLQIEKDGKVSQSSLVDPSLRGSQLEKSVQDLVKRWSFPGVKSQLKVRSVLARVNPLMSGSSPASHPSQIWIDGAGWVSAHVLMNLLSSNWGYSMSPLSSSRICPTYIPGVGWYPSPCNPYLQSSSSSSQRCSVFVPSLGWISLPCDQVMRASSSSSSQTCFRVNSDGSVVPVPCDQAQLQASSSSQMCTVVLPNGSTTTIPCQIMQASSSSSSQRCQVMLPNGSVITIPCDQLIQSASSQWCQVTLPNGSTTTVPCSQILQASSSSSQNCFRVLPNGSIISVPCNQILQSSQQDLSQKCHVFIPNIGRIPCESFNSFAGLQSSSPSGSMSNKCHAYIPGLGYAPCESFDSGSGMQASSSSSQNCFRVLSDGSIISVPCSQVQMQSSFPSPSQGSSSKCTVILENGQSIPCEQFFGSIQSAPSSQMPSQPSQFPYSSGSSSLSPLDIARMQASSGSQVSPISAPSAPCHVILSNGQVVSCDDYVKSAAASQMPSQFPPSSGSSPLSPSDIARMQASSGSLPSGVVSPSAPCQVMLSNGQVVSCDDYVKSAAASQMVPGQFPQYPFPGSSSGSSSSEQARLQAASAPSFSPMVNIPGIGQVPSDVLNNAARMQSASYPAIDPNLIRQYVRPIVGGGVATEFVPFPCRPPFLNWPYCGVATEMIAFPDRPPYFPFPMNPVEMIPFPYRQSSYPFQMNPLIQQAQAGQAYNPFPQPQPGSSASGLVIR